MDTSSTPGREHLGALEYHCQQTYRPGETAYAVLVGGEVVGFVYRGAVGPWSWTLGANVQGAEWPEAGSDLSRTEETREFVTYRLLKAATGATYDELMDALRRVDGRPSAA